jgi:hypothetical protein
MRNLSWRIKLGILAIIAIPAFTGYPLKLFDHLIIAGITTGWLGYGAVTHGVLALVLGPAVWGICLSIAVMIMLPVVFGGALISYLLYVLGVGDAVGPDGYSAHYIGLCITMLTVIPLANGLISVIPVHRIENKLLMRKEGVYLREKAALMFVRVFTHIVFFVIPSVLEIVREERQKNEPGRIDGNRIVADSSNPVPMRHKITNTVRMLVYLGVEGICASIQYIPLWAEEIAALPNRRSSNKMSRKRNT